MKYDNFSMLPERAFQPRNGRTSMTLEGGGGGGGHTTSTVTQSNIPDWLRPQTEAVLGAGMQEYFQTEFDPATGGYNITGTKPYTPYSSDPRDYFAPFSQQQQDVFSEAAGMQTPGGFGLGTQMAGQAGMGGLQSAMGAYDYGQMGAGYGAAGAQLGAQGGAQYGGLGAGYGMMGAGLAPEAQMYGRAGADIGMMGLRAEELGRDVGEEARQYARQAAGMGGTYEQMATDPMSMQAYMSPYMQNVIEIQKQQAIEDAQRAQLGANLGAARQGTYGGARQTLAQSQREAALNKQLSDIQGRGLQDAFQQAQQAQQFGVTTGLQGLQGAQAGLGTALQGGQLGLSGIGQAIAGQQAGLAGLGRAGEMYGLGMQGAGLGLQGVQQQLAGTAQGMQGAGLGLQGISGAQAGYGLMGQMGRSLSDISAQQQQSDIARLDFQRQIAALPQEQQQQIINQAIQNFALAEEMPMQRLAGYNALLRGYATPTSTVSQYQAQPSGLQQLAGLGTTAAGIGTIAGVGRKEGGVIKFAEGGITDINALEGMAEDLSIPQIQQSMKNETLPKYVGMPILEQKVNEAERMKMAQAMMSPQQGQQQSISDALMAKADQLQGAGPVMAAGGGIVAFRRGGSTEEDEIERILAEAQAGRGPNVQRVPDDPAERQKVLQRVEDYRKDMNKAMGITDIVPPSTAPAAAPPAAPPPPAEQKTDMATLLAEREAQQKAFLGEDPSIKKMRESLAKQGEDTLLDRILRGSQMVFAGEQLRTRGDTAGLEKVIADEAKRAETAAEREARLAELEGADYRRKADIYKEVAGEERKKAETASERAFQEKVLERKLQVEKELARMKPASASEYIGNLLRSKDRKEREVGKMLLGQSKTGAMTRKDAAEMVLKANPTLAFAGKEQELEDAINRIMSTLGGGSGGGFKVLGRE